MESTTSYANTVIYIIEGLLVAFILINILKARGGKRLFIRRIQGLNYIDDAVGRATEMGKPIAFSPGIGGLSILTLQALSGLTHVVRKAARYGTRVIACVCDAMIYTIADEMCKDAYEAENASEFFNGNDIRFLSDSQFSYASAFVGMLHRERPAAVFLFGHYAAESLILAENGQAVGGIQIAGTPDTTQVPFFLATCDYTIIGDEYYAAGAYLSKEPTLLGSLVGQDYGKIVLIITIIIGIAAATCTALAPGSTAAQWLSTHFLEYFK